MLDQRKRAIGIIDSGIGGFSVAKVAQQCLPNENFIYLGDGANTPYGNLPQTDILTLTKYMVQFMAEWQVKSLLVACNTISCLIDEYQDDIDCPVFSVVQAGAEMACNSNARKIGIISTCFTESTGCYPLCIANIDSTCEVIGHGCPNLAGLIEQNLGEAKALPLIDADLTNELDALVNQDHIEACVLGCTHYPLVQDRIHSLYPSLTILDPAQQMVDTLTQYLESVGLINDSGVPGRLDIFTTGNPEEYIRKSNRAGLYPVTSVGHYPPCGWRQAQ